MVFSVITFKGQSAIGTAMLASTNTLIFLPHATALSKAGPEIRL